MIVSFDVFDTLLCRLVKEPTDVFRLMEVVASDLCKPGFAEARIEAEMLARKRVKREEISLQEIYAAIAPEYQAMQSKLMQIEIDTEKRVCVARADVVEELRNFQRQNIRTIGISDMYLPETVIAEMLKLNGIELDHLYVSSTVGKTKSTGNLYAYVRDQECVSYADWLHFGDNRHSDIENALMFGIDCHHRPVENPQCESIEFPSDAISLSIISGVVRSLTYAKRPGGIFNQTWFMLGAEHTALMAMLLCKRVKEKADETQSTRIYFLARDGFVLEKIYNLMYPDDPRRKIYLAASRRMINFLATTSVNKNYEFLTANSIGLKPSELIERLGVTPQDDLDERFGSLVTSDEIARSVIQLHEIDILNKAEAERKVVTAYLAHAGLFDEEDSVLVDVGWYCSIQKNLQNLIAMEGKRPRLHGIYFGTHVERTDVLDAEGLFYTNRHPLRHHDVFNGSLEVVELLFTAPEQSIISVEPFGSGYNFKRLQNAHEDARIRAAEHIVDGAISAVTALKQSDLIDAVIDIDSDTIMSRFSWLLKNPAKSLVDAMTGINHSSGFGGSEFRPMVLQRTAGLGVQHLIREHNRSYWPRALYLKASPRQRLILNPLTIKTLQAMHYGYRLLPSSVQRIAKRCARRILKTMKSHL